MSPIHERAAAVIAGVLKHDNFTLSPETTAKDIEGWDSLSHLMIITALEKEFGIRFKLKELNRLKDIGSLLELIDAKLAAA